MPYRRTCRAVLVAFSAAALAPAAAGAQAAVGIHVGGGISNVYGDDVGSGGMRRVGQLGGWLRLPVAGPLSIQFEAVLAQRGFRGKATEDASAGLALTFVDFPVLLQLRRTEGSLTGVFTLGAAMEHSRSCRAEVWTQDAKVEVDCETLNADEFRLGVETWTPSVVFGGGAEWHQGPVLVSVEMRGQIDVQDAVQILVDPQTYQYGSARTGGLYILLSAGIPLR